MLPLAGRRPLASARAPEPEARLTTDPDRPHLSSGVRELLRCPACRGKLDAWGEAEFICRSIHCRLRFPVVDGIPILINESTSVFSVADFLSRRDTTFKLKPGRFTTIFEKLLAALPDIHRSFGTSQNYARFRDELLATAPAPRVLVVGGSIVGQGMDELARDTRIEFVASDVSFGPKTDLICDAHDLPFEDQSFDGLIAQAVLEHVVDPPRCVQEFYRVLKRGALVYAETPFMQQVHMGSFDFTRFTHSGHRRLFRHFSEIASGALAGPGVALAWSYQYFLLSFATSRVMRGLLRAFARLTAFHLKYLDRYLAGRPGAIDGASGFFFLGRKDGHTLSDRDLIKYYRGALSN